MTLLIIRCDSDTDLVGSDYENLSFCISSARRYQAQDEARRKDDDIVKYPR